jgi:cob(I)alamin adenosyltransferase
MINSNTPGYIHVYTGNGKGKTTAAIGLAVRAAGAGIRVFIAQFAKGSLCSEHRALKRFDDLITIRRYGKKTFITGTPQKSDRLSAQKGLSDAAMALKGNKYGMVVLDEACYALSAKLFKFKDLKKAIEARCPDTEVIITGRNASAELIKMADLVTEMKMLKHYYNRGVNARKGIEM